MFKFTKRKKRTRDEITPAAPIDPSKVTLTWTISATLETKQIVKQLAAEKNTSDADIIRQAVRLLAAQIELPLPKEG